jgi:hypothetical protein
MSQINLIPTPSWLVYFVLKAQPLLTLDYTHIQKEQICG